MSDSRFDRFNDPVATPNPAYDDDCEPASAGSPAPAFDHPGLAQTILHRAHARQEAIADAFVDALLAGKTQLFRILLELEKAAVTAQAEAEDARRPGLADILLPMLQRERAQAAANAAQNEAQNQTQNETQNDTTSETRNDPGQPHESPRHIHALSAPAPSQSEEAAPPQPGITDIQATADQPCRSRTVAHHRRRAATRPHQLSIPGPGFTDPQFQARVSQISILRPGIAILHSQARPPQLPTPRPRTARTLPLTLLTLTAVAAPKGEFAIRIPIRLQSYGMPRPVRLYTRCNSFKRRHLQA